MTLTLVSEAAARPKGGRAAPYTPEEDGRIREMLAAGYKFNDIAAALGRTRWGIRRRCYAVIDLRPQRGRGNALPLGIGHCTRCGLLLVAAPAGDGQLCGWCEREARP